MSKTFIGLLLGVERLSLDFCWMSKDFRWTAAVVRDQVLNLQGRHRGNDFLSSVFSFRNEFYSQIYQIHQPIKQTIPGSNFCPTWRKKASHSLNAIDPSPFSSILANVFSLSSASLNKVVMLTKRQKTKTKRQKRQSQLEQGDVVDKKKKTKKVKPGTGRAVRGASGRRLQSRSWSGTLRLTPGRMIFVCLDKVG